MSCATTYLRVPLVDKSLEKTVAHTREEAAKRLGGNDGLEPVQVSPLGDEVGVLWRREWKEHPAKPAK
jgi:hypothetical protein